MSTVGNWRGSNFVKDGLVLYLDAGSPNSYFPTIGGNIWKDISGNNLNGTMNNGAVYDSSNGGNILFDGISSNVDLGDVFNPGTTFSIECWVNVLNDRLVSMNIIDKIQKERKVGYLLSMPDKSTGISFSIYDKSTKIVTITTSEFLVIGNVWNHICVTSDGKLLNMYINGQINNQIRSGIENAPSSKSIEIGKGGVGSDYMNGKISIVRFYSKCLSENEVFQNYNSSKDKFI